ncbi:MAG: GAF domain-containing protein [Desulfatibacillaceae bacterium]
MTRTRTDNPTPPTEAAAQAARQVVEGLGCPMASVEMVGDGYVQLIAFHRGDKTSFGGRVPLEMHPCHRALREKAVCRLNDAGRIFPDVPWFDANAVNSYVAVPVQDEDGTVVAYLAAMDHGRSAFVDRDVQLLWEINRRVAGDLVRRTEEPPDTTAAESARLRMATALLASIDPDEILGNALDCLASLDIFGLTGNASLFLYNSDTDTLDMAGHRGLGQPLDWCSQRVPMGECLCGMAALERRTVVAEDAHKRREHTSERRDVQAHGDLCVPLTVRERLVGVLRMQLENGEPPASSVELVEHLAGQMAQAFVNSMACAGGEGGGARRAKVQSQQKRIRELQIGLAQARRAKSDFLSGMSHELRTPLNAIIGFSQVLQEEYFGELNDKQKQYVSDILESGQHLLALISDILDLSRVESGVMELELSRVAVAPLLNGSLIMIREKAHKHGIRLEVDLDDFVRDLSIIADERKLKQVMYNLLANSVKFTGDGGNITVGARLRDESEYDGLPEDSQGLLEVFVADDGVGVATGDQERIFEDFYQVKRGTSGKTPGTGLGLPLTRRLVEMHGGRIWVESEGRGLGSRFAFTLPLDAAELADSTSE